MKTDYPKIDIYVRGAYVASTTWSKTLREAKARYFAKGGQHIDNIKCRFAVRKNRGCKAKTSFKQNPDGSLDYADDDISEYRDSPLWWHTQGLQQTASGYGSKLTTSKMALIGKRWHRVYCICYSNAGTCYILQNGARRIVRG